MYQRKYSEWWNMLYDIMRIQSEKLRLKNEVGLLLSSINKMKENTEIVGT